MAAMSTLPSPHAQTAAATTAGLPRRALAWMLGADALLSFAPVLVLGAAIGWPASLDLPAAQQMQRLLAAPEAVAWGYGLYLMYSLLIAPVMIGLAMRCAGGLHSWAGATVAAFATLSALARALGILRWLTVMPALAAAHARADASSRSQLEQLFEALNAYGGGIGELLGVSLFMAIALGTLGWSAWRRAAMPRWLAGSAIAVAAILAALFTPALGGPEWMPMAVAVSALALWMLAAALWLAREQDPGHPRRRGR
jgi:hypothetical protein